MKMNEEDVYIKSVSEFIDVTFSKIEKLGNGLTWFRGEESKIYKLVPNLYRKDTKEGIKYCSDIQNPKDVAKVEQNIDMSFYRKANVFLAHKGIANTPWNRYFLKQHYGVRTRLLDWTENALFALFFAVNNIHVNGTIDEDAKVWLLSPFRLNNFSIQKLLKKDYSLNRILTCSKLEKEGPLFNKEGELRTAELLRKYYRMDCKNNERMFPLAIYPPHLDERMSAQQACFTLFGNIVEGLDCTNNEAQILDCIYIKRENKIKILNDLRRLGVSYYSIYPDLNSLGKTINYDHYNDIKLTQEDNEFLSFFSNDIKS